MMMKSLVAGIVTLGLLSAAHAACQLEQLAELHVEKVAGEPLVAGAINGHPVHFLLQTATPYTNISSAAAQQLGLAVHEYNKRTLYTAAGNVNLRTAVVSDLQIGNLRVKDYTLGVVDRNFPADRPASLQLGADVLGQFTTEFDLAAGAVRMFRARDCKLEQLTYWSPMYFQVDLKPGFIVDVKVNGTSQRARLSTGSGRSYISVEAAREAGVSPDSAGVQPAAPITGWTETPIPTWTARFDSIEFGAETIKNPHLRIGDIFPHGKREETGKLAATRVKSEYGVDLGLDFFLAHRIMFVPDSHVALLTYNRGAAFAE